MAQIRRVTAIAVKGVLAGYWGVLCGTWRPARGGGQIRDAKLGADAAEGIFVSAIAAALGDSLKEPEGASSTARIWGWVIFTLAATPVVNHK